MPTGQWRFDLDSTDADWSEWVGLRLLREQPLTTWHVNNREAMTPPCHDPSLPYAKRSLDQSWLLWLRGSRFRRILSLWAIAGFSTTKNWLNLEYKGDQSKVCNCALCDFQSVRHSNVAPILHRFWDTGNLLAENCKYFLLLSLIWLPWNFWYFVLKLPTKKLESLRYPAVKTAWSYTSLWRTVGQTVKRSDGRIYHRYSTALCKASNAAVLTRCKNRLV